MLRFSTINGLAIAILFILFTGSTFYNIPWWPYLVWALVWFTLTTIGSFHVRWNYHINALHSNKNKVENHIALTFDDGPHPEFTPKILHLLARYNAKATFFCIGKNIETNETLFKDIVTAGHTIGNHTYSHTKSFGFLSAEKVIDELQKNNVIVQQLTGKEIRLYRPAFGVTNPNIKKALKATGLQAIGWSIRSLDTTQRSETQVLRRITKSIAKGDVVLLHDTSDKTVAVLEQLLLFLQEQNLQSVTIDQLFNIKAYA
ncbi:polysaccharide deacetylase family protein [Kriegella aquimaris]|uniref:Peptidoglycan/xylan/chitin deacetylase, PgdA/CDA1 family n=1 Tax=Kriegella aquimaris TaxID=192904 RepID=A0A1G9STD8_9FLAO|nr:polysaccharide deacetylase family protein [Kriegella aquimaris]SDM38680.1 Peptidoglycan/xylan/chitin deacetylase, PgdA/CDA1 family [Kriegella aquimaris]